MRTASPSLLALMILPAAFMTPARADSPCSIKLGDVNFDLKADICDLRALAAHYDVHNPCADFNHDGRVNASDYYVLKEIISREPAVCSEQTGSFESVWFDSADHESPPSGSLARQAWSNGQGWNWWWSLVVFLLIVGTGAAVLDAGREKSEKAGK